MSFLSTRVALEMLHDVRVLINRAASAIVDRPFSSIADQMGVRTRDQNIPTVVYQTWEENSFGRRHRESIREFRLINKDLSFKLFSAPQRDEYMNSAWRSSKILNVYLNSRFGPMRADIFRYCILFERGGYYMDISKGLSVSFLDLHDSDENEIVAFEGNLHGLRASEDLSRRLQFPDNLLLQWGFGFKPNHPLLEILIKDIEARSDDFAGKVMENPKTSILELTGPWAFTQAAHKYLLSSPDLEIKQAGLDFGGFGIYSLKGSGARHVGHPSYAHARNLPILNS